MLIKIIIEMGFQAKGVLLIENFALFEVPELCYCDGLSIFDGVRTIRD